MGRRSRFEVKLQILFALKSGAKSKNRIIYETNNGWKRGCIFLQELIISGLVETLENKKVIMTPKGWDAVDVFEKDFTILGSLTPAFPLKASVEAMW